MKKILILLLVPLFFSCGSKKNALEAAEEVPEVVDDADQSLESAFDQMGKALLMAMTSTNEESVLSFLPDIACARIMSADIAEGKTDEEIKKEMLDPLAQRFKDNIMNLRSNIAENNIEKSLISYVGNEYHESDDPGLIPRALSLNYNVDGNDVTVPVTVAKIGSKWYLFEILHSTGLFDQ